MKTEVVPQAGGWFLIQRRRQQKNYSKIRARHQRRSSPHTKGFQRFTKQSTQQGHTQQPGTNFSNSFLGRGINGRQYYQQGTTHSPRSKQQLKLSFNSGIGTVKTATVSLSRYPTQPKQSNLINVTQNINGDSELIPSTKPAITTKANHAINSSTSYLSKSINSHPSSLIHCINTKPATTFIMSKKRNTPPLQNTHHNQRPPVSPLNPDARSYAQITTPPPNIQLPPYPPTVQRYQSPPWQHFLDQNPWQFSHIQNDSMQTDQIQPQEPLPLPPEPGHPKWRGRCYNCLKFGHDQNECRAKERVCANCWNTGHEAKNCEQTPLRASTHCNPEATWGKRDYP